MNKLFGIAALALLLLPAEAFAALPKTAQCAPFNQARISSCGPANTGLMLNRVTHDLHYQVLGVEWLELTGSGSTLTFRSDQGTTFSFASALSLDSTLSVTGAVTITGALTVNGGQTPATGSITDTTALAAADCGEVQFTTAGIDTKTITLPATIAGCEYTIMYVGADGGALVDVSPNASDAIHGSCTLAASVVEFSGTDDADIGLTKATANTGDTITLVGDGTEGWYVKTCTGIWANN